MKKILIVLMLALPCSSQTIAEGSAGVTLGLFNGFNVYQNNIICGGIINATTSFTVGNIYFGSADAGPGSWQGAIYKADGSVGTGNCSAWGSPGTFVCSTSTVTISASNRFQGGAANGCGTLPAGTYWVCGENNSTSRDTWDSSSVACFWNKSNTFGSWPSTLSGMTQRTDIGWPIRYAETSIANPAVNKVGGETSIGTIPAGGGGGNNSINGVLTSSISFTPTGNSITPVDIKVYMGLSSGTGNVVCGLYDSDGTAGAPGTKLCQGTAKALATEQWNVLPVSCGTLTASHKYWLACNNDQSGAYLGQNAAAGTWYNQASAYNGTMPNYSSPSSHSSPDYSMYLDYTVTPSNPGATQNGIWF